jgi:uncharacterized protein YndB with AHSA1/START domain
MNVTAALTLALALAPAAEGAKQPAPTPTDRSIIIETVVEAPPDEVFRLWTSADGVSRFFARGARIDPRKGGRYEIVFDPYNDPEGARAGTKGARVLAYRPPERLEFEWSVGVPDVTWELKSADFATWVELDLAAVPGRPGATRVRLTHQGFLRGESWDTAYAYFEKAWSWVLGNLETYCRDGKTPF